MDPQREIAFQKILYIRVYNVGEIFPTELWVLWTTGILL